MGCRSSVLLGEAINWGSATGDTFVGKIYSWVIVKG